jgi:hypothetical protein
MALKMHQPFRAVGKPISATKSARSGLMQRGKRHLSR